jgi:hypothetical protein
VRALPGGIELLRQLHGQAMNHSCEIIYKKSGVKEGVYITENQGQASKQNFRRFFIL